MVQPVVTFVNIRTLPLVDGLAVEIHKGMRKLIVEASRRIRKWYAANHYNPPIQLVQKATAEEVKAAQESVDKVLDSLDWPEMFTPLFDYMAKVYQTGKDVPSTQAYRPLDLNFVNPDPSAVKYAQRRSAELVGKRILEDGTIVDNPDPHWAVTPGLREDIRKTVQAALEEGPTPGDLSKEIEHLAGFQPPRARMIARTELAFAYNAGHHDQAHRMGYHLKASLLGSLHKQTDECDQNAAVGYIPIDQPFPSGDEMAPYHPNCVCDLAYKTKEGPEETERAEQVVAQQTDADVAKEVQSMASPKYTPTTPEEMQQYIERASTYLEFREILLTARERIEHYTDKFTEKAKERTKERIKRRREQNQEQPAETLEQEEASQASEEKELIRIFLETGVLPALLKELLASNELSDSAVAWWSAHTDRESPETLKVLEEYIDDPANLVQRPLYMGAPTLFASGSHRLKEQGEALVVSNKRPGIGMPLIAGKDRSQEGRYRTFVVRTVLTRGTPVIQVPGSPIYMVAPDRVQRVMDVSKDEEGTIRVKTVLLPHASLDGLKDHDSLVVYNLGEDSSVYFMGPAVTG